MNQFDFKTQLGMSFGTAVDVQQVLAELPGALGVEKAARSDDKNGTDYWIRHVRGTPISVDTKVRSKDPLQAYGKDDLALETWSAVDQKIGWTLDETKRTDYILWWFTPTGRWVLVPFLQLCAAFKKRRDVWAEHRYRVERQWTMSNGRRAGWQSECVFVPRREIWAAIYKDFSGAPSTDPLHEFRAAAPINSNLLNGLPRTSQTCDVCGNSNMIILTTEDSVGVRQMCPRCWKEQRAA